MRALAEFVMRGRKQAALVVAGAALVPLLSWLSASACGLVLLRRGLNDALGVLIWALLPALLCWYLGDPSILLLLVGTSVLAQVLRTTTSWVWVMVASVLLGVVFAGVLSVFSKELIKALAEMFGSAMARFQAQAGLPVEDASQVQQSLVPLMTGMFASSLQMVSLLCLMLARYWQAALFNPGGFGQEFRALRLPAPLAVLLLVGVLLAPQLDAQASMLAQLCTIPLLLAGIALGHGLIKIKRLSGGWVFGLYVVVVLLGNLICLLAVIDGLFDFRGRLARRQDGTGPTNGEG